jgi:hypothetical protein
MDQLPTSNFPMERWLPDPIRWWVPLPLFVGKVAVGDHIEKTLDLSERLIKKPAATFFCSCPRGVDDRRRHCHDNILIVDRSIDYGNLS